MSVPCHEHYFFVLSRELDALLIKTSYCRLPARFHSESAGKASSAAACKRGDQELGYHKMLREVVVTTCQDCKVIRELELLACVSR